MIVLGRLVAPFGIKGWMHLHPFGDDPETWGRMPELWLGSAPDARDWKSVHPEQVKPHGDGWTMKLLGIEDRGGAEALSGYYIAAPRERLPAPGQGEYYWADLVGLRVVNEAGAALGRVESLIETGANDVLVVREGNRERLMPFVEAVVKAVDVPGGMLRVAWGDDW